MVGVADAPYGKRRIKLAKAAITPAYTSSDEEEENPTTGQKAYKAKKLPWESEVLTRIKRVADEWYVSHVLNHGAQERMKPTKKDNKCHMSCRPVPVSGITYAIKKSAKN